MEAKEFYENEDQSYDEDWIVQVENIFKVFICTGRQEVSLAAYMFHGVADTCWKSVREPYQTITHVEAWNTFKKEYMEKFNPEHIFD